MKKVLPVRIPVYLKAELASGRKNYSVIIGNLSEKGVFLETDPTKSVLPFLPGKTLKLKFEESPGNIMNLNCEVIWLYTKKTSPRDFTNSIGLKIKKTSSKYKKYFQSL